MKPTLDDVEANPDGYTILPNGDIVVRTEAEAMEARQERERVNRIAESHPPRNHVLRVSEEERQAVILALAALSVERPGWLDFLQRIAKRLDPKLMLFERFRSIRKPGPGRADDDDEKPSLQALVDWASGRRLLRCPKCNARLANDGSCCDACDWVAPAADMRECQRCGKDFEAAAMMRALCPDCRLEVSEAL